jgi:L-ribulose-5-phosphate 4-epimerase
VFEQLKAEVFQANVDLVRHGLVTLTWGNVSGVDSSAQCMAIKPSGVDYESMTADDMVLLDMKGNIMEGRLRPSSDAPTHLALYKAFSSVGGIVHTHSIYAVMFAQACREIPCLGTTHADHFNGPVPVTRFLTGEEVQRGYESETGKIIIERFADMDPAQTPGVLVAGHAPFAWGANAAEAVKNSLILERIAQMALGTFQLNPAVSPLPEQIQIKHYQRKHGPDAYYGQNIPGRKKP